MIEVRPATAEDDASLLGIDHATWSPVVTPAPPRPERRRFFADEERPADVLVAEQGGTVVGYVRLHQPIPLPSHRHVLEVNGLAVAPEAHRAGVGRALVECAKHEASVRGATRLTLRVLGGNTGARRLYESCGFVVEGVLVGEFVLDGQPVDDVLMACSLG